MDYEYEREERESKLQQILEEEDERQADRQARKQARCHHVWATRQWTTYEYQGSQAEGLDHEEEVYHSETYCRKCGQVE